METVIALTQVINDFEGLIREMDWAVKVVIVSVCLISSLLAVFVLPEVDKSREIEEFLKDEAKRKLGGN